MAIDSTLTRDLGSNIAIALDITLVVGLLTCCGSQTVSIAAMLAVAGLTVGARWGGLRDRFAAGWPALSALQQLKQVSLS